jgi:hypothetical protein
MHSVAWRYIPISLGVLTVSVTSALAASAGFKPGCPVITRAQAAAALGSVKKIEHVAQHTPGPGGGVTWLQQCSMELQGRPVDVVFSGSDKQSFNGERQGLAQLGKVKVIRGLGLAAYLYDGAERELHVLRPKSSKHGQGAFAIRTSHVPSIPVRSLVALARAVLKAPTALSRVPSGREPALRQPRGAAALVRAFLEQPQQRLLGHPRMSV